MANPWRWLNWGFPLAFVVFIFALAWHFDPDFWRPADSLMQQAQEAARQGDFPRALDLARKACRRDPANIEYSLILSRYYLEAGQPQPALDLCRRLEPQAARSPRGLTIHALALDRLGDRPAALELLAGGLKDNPEDADLLATAAALADQGSFDRPRAIEYYQRLYRLTRSPQIRRKLVELLISLNRYPEALPLQEEEAAEFPHDAETLRQLALLHYWQRDYLAAGRLYQRLLEKAGGDAALRLEAARNAEAAQQLDQALSHYLWLYSRSQGQKEYALALAKIWSRKGNHAEAAGILAPLMQDNPAPELRRQYALELLIIGNFTEARKTYEAAWQAGDAHQETIVNLARLYGQKGQFARAAAMWEEAERRQLLKGDLRWEAALAYSYAHRYGEALKVLQPLRRRNSQDPKLLLFSGQLHFYQKDWGQAAHYFSAYLKQRPKDIEVRRQLAEALSFAPDTREEALTEYAQILRIKDDPGLRLRRIGLLLETRRWEEAARELKNCPVPEDPRLLREQARLLVWAGDLPAARRCYDLLLPKTQEAAVRLEQAQVLIYLGRGPEALELLNRLRQEQPRNQAVIAAAVEAHLASQDFAKALHLARRELEPLPDLTLEERALVARCYYHAGDPKKLRHTCDLLLQNLRRNRYHHPSLLILGALLPRLPHYEDLNYVMDRVPGIKRGGPEFSVALAYFDGQLGRQGGKLSYLLHVIREYQHHRQPDSPGELLGLAWLALELGDRQAAAQYYRRALKLKPNDPQIKQLARQCQEARQDWSQLLADLEQQPDNAAAPLEMARIYLRRGQYEGVKALDRRIPPDSPDRVAYLQLLAEAYRHEKSFPEALQTLAQLEGRIPPADYLMEKALILEGQGDQRAKDLYGEIIAAQPHSQAARVARARRDRAAKHWSAAFRAYEAALKEAPQDIQLLNELEYVRAQMRPEMASRGFPYYRGERRPEEARRPYQFSRFGREPGGLGLSNYLPAFISDVLPVVQPESLYFTDSNKLHGWIVRLSGGFWLTKVLPVRLGLEYREYNQNVTGAPLGQLNLGLNPVYNQTTTAASRLRRAEVSLGLGPLSVDDRLRLSGDLILRRYWKRDDYTVTQQGQLRQWVLFPPPPHFQTLDATAGAGITSKDDHNRLLGSLELGFSPTSRTDAALRYSRRDIYDQESYLFPRLYQSVLNLAEARVTTYHQADLSYTHQFKPGLDWRGAIAGAFYSDQNRRFTLYQGLAWQVLRQPRMHLELTPHYYLAAFAQQRQAYFSPASYNAFGLGFDFDRQLYRLPTLILQGTVQGVTQHGDWGPALQGLAALEWEFVANFYMDLHFFYFREFVDNYRLWTAGVSFRWKF